MIDELLLRRLMDDYRDARGDDQSPFNVAGEGMPKEMIRQFVLETDQMVFAAGGTSQAAVLLALLEGLHIGYRYAKEE